MQVAVIGAGPVGLVTGMALAERGYAVRIFDPATEKPKMTLALAESTLALLSKLQVPEVAGEALQEIHISERGVPGSAMLSASELGLPRFGQVTCSHALEAALADRASAWIEAKIVTSVRARGAETPPELVLADGEQLHPDLVILADGGRSPLTASLGFVAHQRPFGRTALLGRLRVTHPIPGRAYERFVGTGPLALLPLSDGLYGFVWSLSPEDAARFDADHGALLTTLAATLDPALGEVTLATSPVQIPLIERWIDQPYRPGVLLLGNGAQTIHPVAGQGMNLALRGLAKLLDTLEQLPIDAAVQRAFSEWQADRNRTRFASSALEALFDVPAVWRRAGTAVGMALFDQSLPLKRRLAEAGMGMLS